MDSFAPTQEQGLLAESLERFFAKEYGFDRRRAIAASEHGFDRAAWARFAEFGWLGIGIPEERGGLGGTAVEIALVMQAIGRHLVLEPYLSTAVVGAGLLRRAGEPHAKLLADVAAGKILLALAHGEKRARFDLAHVETRAERTGTGYTLSGHKAVVPHAETADHLIVSARSAGAAAEEQGVTLFLVPRGAKGIGLQPYATIDGQRAAEVTLDRVALGADAVLGMAEAGHDLIARVAEDAIVALSAEAVGAMDALIGLTRDYLKTRKQFGVPIGSFQVLQHRLVDLFMAQALARSTAEAAARALSSEDARYRAATAAAAKVQAGRAGRLVGQEAVQLHGGMGMTAELAVGAYFKRLFAIDVAFGNADWHQRRFAGLANAGSSKPL